MIDRRLVLTAGAGALAANALMNAAACTTTGTAKAGEDHHHHGQASGLAGVAAECVAAGEACIAHCLVLLGEGDASLAPCAKAVNDMLAGCRATTTLAASNSQHLKLAAQLCIALCTTCETACQEHAAKHAECAACAKACRATIEAAQAHA